jgi:hypothetical protein
LRQACNKTHRYAQHNAERAKRTKRHEVAPDLLGRTYEWPSSDSKIISNGDERHKAVIQDAPVFGSTGAHLRSVYFVPATIRALEGEQWDITHVDGNIDDAAWRVGKIVGHSVRYPGFSKRRELRSVACRLPPARIDCAASPSLLGSDWPACHLKPQHPMIADRKTRRMDLTTVSRTS